jgi:hypothetical protein
MQIQLNIKLITSFHKMTGVENGFENVVAATQHPNAELFLKWGGMPLSALFMYNAFDQG